MEWTEINAVRHSARLPTNIFTSRPHNAPGTFYDAIITGDDERENCFGEYLLSPVCPGRPA